MSNISDIVSHAYENTVHFVEEHPWQAAAALAAWPIGGPAVLVGEAALAGGVKGASASEAGAKLGEGAAKVGEAAAFAGAKAAEKQGEKAEQKMAAPASTEAEKQEAAKIEKLILAGDLKGLKTEMQTYHGHAHDLAGVMAQVHKDLIAKGIVASYSFGGTMWGDGKDFHEEGNLTLFSTDGGKALEVGTDLRSAPNVGGPVQKQKDGTYIDLSMGLPGDPQELLSSLAARKHG